MDECLDSSVDNEIATGNHSEKKPVEDAVVSALGFPEHNWRDLAFCSTSSARALVPYPIAKRICVLPLVIHRDAIGRDLLSAIFAEPLSPTLLQEVKFISGLEVNPETRPRAELEQAILAAYLGQDTHLLNAAERASTELSATAIEEADPSLHYLDDKAESAVPELLDGIINRAHYLEASDVHLEPVPRGMILRFRVDGMLRQDTAFKIPQTVARNLIRRIKILANLDIASPKPQEGGFGITIGQINLRLRVSIIPQKIGDKAVLRLLEFSPKFSANTKCLGTEERKNSFQKLGMTPEQVLTFIAHIGAQSGAILLAGPTGSGKSTLLYAALEYLNEEWRNIVSLEDPVERTIAGINQTEVLRGSGLDYSDMLPLILRQDPDVIMVGEIRDAVTAETALNASLTGHLVLSTVHAGSCLEVIARMQYLQVSPSLLASSIRLLIAQRLIPKNCVYCLKQEAANTQLRNLLKLSGHSLVTKSIGCERCNFSGVVGRMGVFEMLTIGTRLREAIISVDQTTNGAVNLNIIKQVAVEDGFLTIATKIREAIVSGLVSPRWGLRSLGVAPELLGY